MAKSQKKHKLVRLVGNIADEMANDLLSLKVLLSNHMAAYISDLGLLEVAAFAIKKRTVPLEWQYNVERLIFSNLDIDRSGSFENTKLEMTIQIGGQCEVPNPINDLLNCFTLQFLVKQTGGEEVILQNAFRFERHIFNIGDGTPCFSHPLYHFQNGGDAITENDDLDKGHILFVDAPRIMHPPMDIILAIDFVMGNFYSNNQSGPKRLFQDSGYAQIIERARARFWKPYMFGIASNFAGNNHSFQTIDSTVNKSYAKNLLFYSDKH